MKQCSKPERKYTVTASASARRFIKLEAAKRGVTMAAFLDEVLAVFKQPDKVTNDEKQRH